MTGGFTECFTCSKPGRSTARSLWVREQENAQGKAQAKTAEPVPLVTGCLRMQDRDKLRQGATEKRPTLNLPTAGFNSAQ